MPKGVVRTKKQESQWAEAKEITRKQYPEMGETDLFWKIVNSIYQNMTKSMPVNQSLLQKAIDLSFLCPKEQNKRTLAKSLYYLLDNHIENLNKSRKLHKRYKFQGLNISIENKKGSIRHWYDPLKDESGETKMKYDYGYIRLTEGADGDHVDVYVGPDKEAGRVYVVHQNHPTTGKYDEDKVMLGFNTADEARQAYMDHYDDPKFFGSIEEYNFLTFTDKVFKKKGKVTGKSLEYSEKLQKAKYISRKRVKGKWQYKYSENKKIITAKEAVKNRRDLVNELDVYNSVIKRDDKFIKDTEKIEDLKIRPGKLEYENPISYENFKEESLEIDDYSEKDLKEMYEMENELNEQDRNIVNRIKNKIKKKEKINPIIIDESNNILDGNHTYLALKELNIEKFPILRRMKKSIDFELLIKAVKIKKNYSADELKNLNMRWVTIRGNHVLLQGMSDGSFIVVGGAGGKLNHMRIDSLLSDKEYKARRKEKKEAQLTDLTSEEISEQTKQRKEEVVQKKMARTSYETAVKDILGLTAEEVKSNITAKEMDDLYADAKKKVAKKKKLDESIEPKKKDIEAEAEKLLKEKKHEEIKKAEKAAMDVLADDFFGEGVGEKDTAEALKDRIDVDTAMQILKARKMFRKELKDINAPKRKKKRLSFQETYAKSEDFTDESVLTEVKNHIDTMQNIRMYETLDRQSEAIQKHIDNGASEALNGIVSDVYSGGAALSSETVQALGMDACVQIISNKLYTDGNAEKTKDALIKFVQKNNTKIVKKTLKEMDERFHNADVIRGLSGKDEDPDAILSIASANGYALRQLTRGQQVLGTAVGSLRSAAHLINTIEEGQQDKVFIDMGNNLARARKNATKAGFKRGEYKIKSKLSGQKGFIMEIPKASCDKFFEKNKKIQEEETKIDRIKSHKENDGYVPEGMKSGIKLDPAQEAGLKFFMENDTVLLDFEAGLGKCLSFSTLINLNNGTLRKAGEIFDSNHKDEEEIEKEIWLDPIKKLKVFSMNEKGKVVEGEIEKLYRQRIDNDVFEIKTENGFEGGFSVNEPFPVLEYGKIKWKRAFNLNEGDYIVMPDKIPFKGKKEDVNLMELMGWQLSDGCENKNGSLNIATAINESSIVVEELIKNIDYISTRRKSRDCNLVCIGIKNGYKELLKSKGYEWGKKREFKDIPDFIMKANNESTAAFIRGYFSGDGYITKDNIIGVTSVSKNMMIKLSYLLLRFGIKTTIERKLKKCQGWKDKKEYWELRLDCIGARIFKEEIGFAGCKHKEERLEKMKELKSPQKNGYPINDLVIAIRDELKVSNRTIINNHRIFKSERLVTKNNIKTIIDNLKKIENTEEYINDLEILLKAEIYTTKIKSIKRKHEKYVYGLMVKKYHNLICGDGAFIVHNTAIGYSAIMEAMNNKGVKKALFVTPAKLRTQTSTDESKVFLTKENQSLVKNTDGKTMSERKAIYEQDGIHFIGHDQLRSDAKLLKEAGYDMIVVDEIHEMTNQREATKTKADSGRYRGMMTLSDIPLKIGMSGTNIKSSKKELYKKINFLDPNHDLGTMKEFENRYKGLNQGSNAFQDSSNNAFRKEVAKYSYTQKKKLDVKNNQEQIRMPMTPSQKKAYKDSEQKYVKEKNSLNKTTSNAAAGRRESRNYDIVHNGFGQFENSKMDSIVNQMDEIHPGEKAVIHCYRKNAIKTAVKKLESKYGKGSVAVIDGDSSKGHVSRTKATYNDPSSKLKFLIGTKSVEAGLNLQHGGRVTFHLDVPMDEASKNQREGRQFRRGQEQDCHSYMLVTETPFDINKIDMMERKGREMKILGNPASTENKDESGFLAMLNQVEKETGYGA